MEPSTDGGVMDTLPGAEAPRISAKSNDALLGIPYLRDTTLRSCKKTNYSMAGTVGCNYAGFAIIRKGTEGTSP